MKSKGYPEQDRLDKEQLVPTWCLVLHLCTMTLHAVRSTRETQKPARAAH